MAVTADFIVIGGGIAGVSVAYELAQSGTVVLLEMESSIGYHSTARSAAVMSENYGPALWSRLVTASRLFLETPPAGFTDVPLVTPRGALFLATSDEEAALKEQADELALRGAKFEVTTSREALRFCPVLRSDEFSLAMYEPDCMDVDTDSLMRGYLAALRTLGGQVVLKAPVQGLAFSGSTWRASTPAGDFEAPVVINAAGGWAQQVASLAGFGYRNVTPFRRTAVTFAPPEGSDIRTWPMTFDVAETFYFKPEGGHIMVSPVDMEPTEPRDAKPDDLEVAIAMDRIERYTTMRPKSIAHSWGGLRTFAPDHEPVIGADPEQSSFIWLAGQGGNGVMGGVAAARLAAGLATGTGVPVDIAALGVTVDNVSPGRECIVNADIVTKVGSIADFE